MKSRILRGALFATIFLIVISLAPSSNNVLTTRAAPSDIIISPTIATLGTRFVTLTVDVSDGIEPEVSHWYDPNESEVVYTCRAGETRRIYQYESGTLVWIRDFFYISGCGRQLGQYSVHLGNWSGTFEIVSSQVKVYLPLIRNPPPEPVPPGAFSKLSPTNGVTEQPFNLDLDWGDSDGADGYDYCFDTTNDNTCTNWISTGTSSQVSLSELSGETIYYWHARATNSIGVTYAGGDPAAFWPFTTGSGSVIPSEMVLIPAGEFQMGCDPDHNGGESCYNPDLPLHTVYLDDYQIDKYEVTNSQYAQCVVAGACQAPADVSSYTRGSYYGNPDHDNYPVIHVTWQNAYDYCAWAGKRLPSEAEWEKAARGATAQAYPWGDAQPTCSLANFSASYSNQCVGDTSPVGDYPDGAGPYGVLDMAGNVWEWVNDWYSPDYYEDSPSSNPPGPDSGTEKVYRGGGWANMGIDIATSDRRNDDPDTSRNDTGFRCAASIEP